MKIFFSLLIYYRSCFALDARFLYLEFCFPDLTSVGARPLTIMFVYKILFLLVAPSPIRRTLFVFTSLKGTISN